METVTTDSSTAEKDDSDSEVICLMRVGRNADWLHLFENTEVTIGRGADVTYQLLSPTHPLMISRLHCIFKQRENCQWAVTDKKSLNGVWVNGNRIPAEESQLLKLGDSVQLGVPVTGNKAEYDYILVQRPLKDIKLYLAKVINDVSKAAHLPKKPKRKLTVLDVEPSTSKPKLYRCSSADKSFAKPCPLSAAKPPQRLRQSEQAGTSSQVQELHLPSAESSSLCDKDNLQMYSQNILLLREQLDNSQRQMASMGVQPQSDPLREKQVRELQGQIEALRSKMYQMETLEKSFSETIKQIEAQRTQKQEGLMKKQLEEAMQEAEKERAKAQKEEIVTQVTEVLENELQCIICSELFIEAVILNCAHSFCCHCIKQWRKKKDECPMCRRPIQSQTRCLALDNCISGMVENLSLDMKARRQAVITERKAADSTPVLVIHDDSSSSSSNSSSSSSSSSNNSSSSSNDNGSSLLSSDSSFVSVVSVDSDSSFHHDSSSHSDYED